jgi:pyruvoyl-dependent arginine decarboxylase (PvlArgDC)
LPRIANYRNSFDGTLRNAEIEECTLVAPAAD